MFYWLMLKMQVDKVLPFQQKWSHLYVAKQETLSKAITMVITGQSSSIDFKKIMARQSGVWV